MKLVKQSQSERSLQGGEEFRSSFQGVNMPLFIIITVHLHLATFEVKYVEFLRTQLL